LPINRSAIKESKDVKGTPDAKCSSEIASKDCSIKKYEASLKEEDLTRATELLKEAGSALDKAAQKGVIHRSQADRRKSRLTRKLNAMSGKPNPAKKGSPNSEARRIGGGQVFQG